MRTSSSRIVGKKQRFSIWFDGCKKTMFDDDCMHLSWGSELMRIRVRIARKSRGLVLGLLVG